MSRWFFIAERKAYPAAVNMAVDEYLLQIARERKCGFFRLYSWEKPSFSFGVSQKSVRAINRSFIETNSCEYVRRVTGGKTVLHHDEITYAVVSSEEVFYREHDLYQSYMLISRVLVEALQRVGIPAYLSSGSTPEMSRSNHPCFSFPTPNEIEVNGKKIIGSAQKRDQVALLQHGSIPFSMDFDLYAKGANSQAEFISSSMTTVSSVSSVSKTEVRDSLMVSFREFLHTSPEPFSWEEDFNRPELHALIEKYRSEWWNFSR